MKDIKIALIHCPETTTYKLVQLTEDLNDNPCVVWVFDSSRMNMAKKIMKNMNVAKKLNLASDLSFV